VVTTPSPAPSVTAVPTGGANTGGGGSIGGGGGPLVAGGTAVALAAAGLGLLAFRRWRKTAA
jgi:lysozyme family protein